LKFAYLYSIWDRRLVIVIIVILASLTCLITFILYKLRVVKRTKKELIESLNKSDRLTLREQRKRIEENNEASVTVYS